MRLWPLVIALVVWTASLSASTAAETSSGSFDPPFSQRESFPGGSARANYFGVMGEVAHPGTYAAPTVWTVTELIKRAGGITSHANKTVRVFRGGLLTEQMFLGSGENSSLLPNDLIVVGARDSSRPRLAPADADPRLAASDANRGPDEQAAIAAVQLAFVNLLARPVIVKMPGNQATLARIVELLGQPADCAANIRVFAPLGSGPPDLLSIDQATRPLDSETVLVFAASSIHLESLPALPEPIGETAFTFFATPSPRISDFKRADANPSERKQGNTLHADIKLARPSRPLEVTAEGAVDPEKSKRSGRRSKLAAVRYRSASRIGQSPSIDSVCRDHPGCNVRTGPGTLSQGTSPRTARGKDGGSHGGHVRDGGTCHAFDFCLDRETMVGVRQAPLRRPTETAISGSSPVALSPGVPVPPVPMSLVGRPIRIDAGQPLTRLSVDLAVIERSPHSSAR